MSQADVQKGAVISDCQKYRYALWRTWDDTLREACFICLNPSTADHQIDDPTIRRCVGFARAWGCGGIRVVNLFAYRSTSPSELKKVADPVGPDNDDHIRRAVEQCHPVVAAWGAHGDLHARSWYVKRLVARCGVPMKCLGLTHGGHPKHPLYIKSATELIPFGVTAETA